MRDPIHRIARSHNQQLAVRVLRAFVLMCAVLFGAQMVPAYSVLTHEQVVDLLWKDQVEPLLKKRFPQATEKDLLEAHAYAYGGT